MNRNLKKNVQIISTLHEKHSSGKCYVSFSHALRGIASDIVSSKVISETNQSTFAELCDF